MAKNKRALTQAMKRAVVEVYSQHPELNNEEKTEILNERLGTDYSSSAFRKYYAAYTQAYDEAINENASEKKLARIAKAQANLMVEQKKNTLMKRGIHTALRHKAKEELFLDAFKDALDKIEHKPFKIKKRARKRLKTPNTMVMLWGDAQIGRFVDLPHNKYNLEIAKSRTAKFVDMCIERAKTEKVKDIVLIDMGDGIDGNSLRDGHLFALEDGLREVSSQLVECYNLKYSIISKLRQEGFNVSFATVPSNHCRTQANKLKNVPLDDYGLAIDNLLNTSLGGKIELEIVDKSNEWFRLSVAGKNFILAHGDKIKKGMAYLPAFFMSTFPTIDFDYIITAHYHHLKHVDRWLQVGALMGTDDYAAGLGYNAPASQAAIVIKDGDIEVYDYQL